LTGTATINVWATQFHVVRDKDMQELNNNDNWLHSNDIIPQKH